MRKIQRKSFLMKFSPRTWGASMTELDGKEGGNNCTAHPKRVVVIFLFSKLYIPVLPPAHTD